jgi:hypothetical protein
MKSLSVFFFSLFFISTAFAQPIEKSLVYSIDDYDYERNYVEVSEEALPSDLYAQLVSMIDAYKFTVLAEENVNTLFDFLKKDRQARNKMAGGNCSIRRAYIQKHLRKISIESGRLYINCPAINGRMRLKDRATNHYYSFANFHDTNIVSVSTRSGRAFRVMDVQFEDAPVSLQDYLAEIEASQKIRPLKRRGTSKGLCYWTVSGANGQQMKKSF